MGLPIGFDSYIDPHAVAGAGSKNAAGAGAAAGRTGSSSSAATGAQLSTSMLITPHATSTVPFTPAAGGSALVGGSSTGAGVGRSSLAMTGGSDDLSLSLAAPAIGPSASAGARVRLPLPGVPAGADAGPDAGDWGLSGSGTFTVPIRSAIGDPLALGGVGSGASSSGGSSAFPISREPSAAASDAGREVEAASGGRADDLSRPGVAATGGVPSWAAAGQDASAAQGSAFVAPAAAAAPSAAPATAAAPAASSSAAVSESWLPPAVLAKSAAIAATFKAPVPLFVAKKEKEAALAAAAATAAAAAAAGSASASTAAPAASAGAGKSAGAGAGVGPADQMDEGALARRKIEKVCTDIMFFLVFPFFFFFYSAFWYLSSDSMRVGLSGVPTVAAGYRACLCRRFRARAPVHVQVVTKDRRRLAGCNCKKSRCVKLYCECYAKKVLCGPDCSCATGCLNTDDPKKQALREKSIAATLKRNEKAFERSTEVRKEPFFPLPFFFLSLFFFCSLRLNWDAPVSPLTAAVLYALRNLASQIVNAFKGCACKRSHCRKNYCDCYLYGVQCVSTCRVRAIVTHRS
jgi:hypothetical protein